MEIPVVFHVVLGLVQIQYFREKAVIPSDDQVILQTDNELLCARQCHKFEACRAFRFSNRTYASVGSNDIIQQLELSGKVGGVG
ncbi:hypothetical protein DPMN_176760 [Dreissena polymorpha]|uniref:Apple domain-containing protein n=1 Tax=Dreissena polymorpha TaxID=45954 RepID=A0A9D4E7I1_DREPO|nr:hypothetical protein DPMN_176760 [Dreissena polymorpha]